MNKQTGMNTPSGNKPQGDFSASGPLDLAGFLGAAKASAVPMRTVDVDVSPLVGRPAGDFLITLRELDACRLFQIEADGQAVRKANPLLPPALATTIALLGLAHVAPLVDGLRPADFYAQLAQANKRVFMALLSRYKEEFPDSTDFGAAVDEAKNG